MVAHLTYFFIGRGSKKCVEERQLCQGNPSRGEVKRLRLGRLLGEEAGFGAKTEGEEVAWGELNGGGISSELAGFRMAISARRLRARPSVEVFPATG